MLHEAYDNRRTRRVGFRHLFSVDPFAAYLEHLASEAKIDTFIPNTVVFRLGFLGLGEEGACKRAGRMNWIHHVFVDESFIRTCTDSKGTFEYTCLMGRKPPSLP